MTEFLFFSVKILSHLFFLFQFELCCEAQSNYVNEDEYCSFKTCYGSNHMDNRDSLSDKTHDDTNLYLFNQPENDEDIDDIDFNEYQDHRKEEEFCLGSSCSNRPRVAIRCNKMMTFDECYARPMARQFNVFNELGFEIQNITDEISDNDNWDLLYTYQHPWFSHLFPERASDEHLFNIAKQHMPNQRINHFPGEGSFVYKKTFSLSRLKHVPKTFDLPIMSQRFIEYNEDGNHKYWVTKDYTHRNVKVEEFKDIDIQQPRLAQEFVDNPLLLDGFMFDIGVYVSLTSVNPLRVYQFDKDWRIKISKKKYFPIDLNDQSKMVIQGQDEVQSMSEIPRLRKYFDKNNETIFSDKEMLLMYFKERAYDMDRVEKNMRNAIEELFLHFEGNVIEESLKLSNTTRNYFGFYRIDLILTENMDVKLIEVQECSMSPSAWNNPEAYKKTESMYFQLFSLVGLGYPGIPIPHVKYSYDSVINVELMPWDMTVFKEECLNYCEQNCSNEVCYLCFQCMSDDDKADIQAATSEHKNKHDFQRVFPRPLQDQTRALKMDEKVKDLNKRNLWMSEWFRGKCLESASWCY